MDMYHTGQKLILDNKRVTKAQASVQVPSVPVEQKSIQDLSLDITATVMTYSHTSPDMQHFLSSRGMNIADDVSQLSNDVLTAGINGSIITIGLKNGHLININSAEYDSTIFTEADNDPLYRVRNIKATYDKHMWRKEDGSIDLDGFRRKYGCPE